MVPGVPGIIVAGAIVTGIMVPGVPGIMVPGVPGIIGAGVPGGIVPGIPGDIVTGIGGLCSMGTIIKGVGQASHQ
eukprot:3192339-Amphidinium_carterae.1